MGTTKVRDRLWLFASRAHDDDPYFGGSKDGIHVRSPKSRITPAEGAFMLGIPNLMMIISDGIPVPYSKDSQGYLESFRRLKKVLWSCTGSAGFRNGNEEDYICDMSEMYPNLMGAYFDDFSCNHKPGGRTTEEVKKLFGDTRKKLDSTGKKMEIWTTCYSSSFHKYPVDAFDDVDVMAIWSMDRTSKENYIEDFKKYEVHFPHKKKAIGIYLYHYEGKEAWPLEGFKMQCETALEWLKSGKINEIVFLTNCTMGIGLETELWLREWIDKVGDEPLVTD